MSSIQATSNAPWTYDQWAAKYGNLRNTNKPLNGVDAGTEYYQQAQQLDDTGLNLDQLQSYIRYWQGLRHNEDARAHPENGCTVDPWYDRPEAAPNYSPGSTYVNGQAGYAASIGQPLYPNGQSAPAQRTAASNSGSSLGIAHLKSVAEARDAALKARHDTLTSSPAYTKTQLLQKYRANMDYYPRNKRHIG